VRCTCSARSRPGRALHDHQRSVAGQRGDRRGLAGIQPPGCPGRLQRRLRGVGVRSSAAGAQPGGQVGLDVEHRPRGPGPDVLGHALARQQRQAAFHRPGGEVLGQLVSHRRVRDDPGGGDQLLGLTADVGGAPRRPAGGRLRQHPLHRMVPVERAGRGGGQVDRPVGVAVAEGAELGPPPRGEVGAGLGSDLVRASVSPGASIPGAGQRRAGVLAGMRGDPLPFVAVQIPRDLPRPSAAWVDEVGELPDLSHRVQGVSVGGQCGPEGGRWRPRRARSR